MTLRSEDFDKLGRSVDDLTRALRDSLQQRGGGGAGTGGGLGGAGAGGAARGSPGTPGDFWGKGARSDTAAGFGLSAVKSALAAGGASGAASLVGGLASGGLPGLGLAAVNEAGKIAQDYRGIHAAGREAARDGASYAGRQASRNFAEGQARVDFVEKYDPSPSGIGFEYGKGFTTKERAERGNDQLRRSQNQREEDRLRSGESAVARTERQIEAISRTGVFNDNNPNREQRDRAEAYAAALYRFNKKQADGVQSGRRYVELIDSHLNAANNQPKVGG